ncbi:MAG: hypothetical protein LQ340_000653 [Diploschistes diacapsis]|nr:MAG: hypothetical protein LQ340_000653 [Diploschistes diacapsis]
MFRPPTNRAMQVLDRSFFKKSVPLAAARVFEDNQIGPLRSHLRRELLEVERISAIRPVPSDQASKRGQKAMLLQPDIRPDDSHTWSPTLQTLVDEGRISIFPYDLHLSYEDWAYSDIITAILPPEANQGAHGIPVGFTMVGHVAHLNLREEWLPHRQMIAAVLLDKNPAVRTVINKIDAVGARSQFRTFQYELLAGDPSLEVEVREQNCQFKFDYSKVYWNGRLSTEHERLVAKFEPGQAVCDVMAGIGPFAIPAGKKKVFVWANDLNPDSYHGLITAITLNKAGPFVTPFNEDGRDFIKRSARDLLKENHRVDATPRRKLYAMKKIHSKPSPTRSFLTQPKTFDHYVMNLPASATAFLDAFIGLYKGQEDLFSPYTHSKLPMVHVYYFSAFSSRSNIDESQKKEICEELSRRLEHTMLPGQNELDIFDVRDVAPSKRMLCASFRLPAEVVFR